MVPVSYYILLGAALFTVGLIGVLTRRNVLVILMSVELMINAANLNLVAFSRYHEHARLDGQIMALFIIVLAAAGAAVGVAIAMNYYKNHASIDVDRGVELRG